MVPVIAAGDGGDERGRAHVVAVSALHVGRVEPQVREADALEGVRLQILDDLVERLADARHLARAHPIDPQRVRHLLDLVRAHPVGDHLRDRGNHRAVDARVLDQQVVRVIRPHPQLGYAQLDRAHASHERGRRYPLRLFPSAHASSACASIISLTTALAVILMSSRRLTIPSSNLGISGTTGPGLL